MWNRNDIVYLVASAQKGFLESYRVAGIREDETGKYYSINIPAKPLTNSAFGDRIDGRHNKVLYFREDDLCDYCQALTYSESYLSNALSEIRALKSAHCEETG